MPRRPAHRADEPPPSLRQQGARGQNEEKFLHSKGNARRITSQQPRRKKQPEKWYACFELGQQIRYQCATQPNPEAVWHVVISLGPIVEVQAPSGCISGISFQTRHLWQTKAPFTE